MSHDAALPTPERPRQPHVLLARVGWRLSHTITHWESTLACGVVWCGVVGLQSGCSSGVTQLSAGFYTTIENKSTVMFSLCIQQGQEPIRFSFASTII